MNIRLPHITGKTPPEQIAQIIRYLQDLVRQLWQLPEQLQQMTQTTETQTQTATDRNRFVNLRVSKKLTVNGGINGVYMRSICPGADVPVRLQSCFPQWSEDASGRQSFFICGHVSSGSILGLVCLDSAGTCSWSGTGSVTVTAEDGGIVRLEMGASPEDCCLIQSPEPFSVL